MGGITGRKSNHIKGSRMTKIILYFTEAETKLLDRVHDKSGLSYHDLIMRAVRAHDRNQRS